MSLSADVISKIVQSLIGLNIYKIILFGSYARGTANEDIDIEFLDKKRRDFIREIKNTGIELYAKLPDKCFWNLHRA